MPLVRQPGGGRCLGGLAVADLGLGNSVWNVDLELDEELREIVLSWSRNLMPPVNSLARKLRGDPDAVFFRTGPVCDRGESSIVTIRSIPVMLNMRLRLWAGAIGPRLRQLVGRVGDRTAQVVSFRSRR